MPGLAVTDTPGVTILPVSGLPHREVAAATRGGAPDALLAAALQAFAAAADEVMADNGWH